MNHVYLVCGTYQESSSFWHNNPATRYAFDDVKAFITREAAEAYASRHQREFDPATKRKLAYVVRDIPMRK